MNLGASGRNLFRAQLSRVLGAYNKEPLIKSHLQSTTLEPKNPSNQQPTRTAMSGNVYKSNFKEFLEIMDKRRVALKSKLENHPFDERRLRVINGIPAKSHYQASYRGVALWMFRDQRVDDNWALILAQKFALQHKCPLYVTFYLMSHYSVAGTRQYDFMLRGLQQVEKQCQKLGIQFHLELGYAKDHIVNYCKQNQIDLVVADFCPLRDPTNWVEEAGRKLKDKNILLYQVDAHNIIPAWVLSNKQEFGARSLRPKLHVHLKEWLKEMPALEKHPHQPELRCGPVDWDNAWKHLKVDETVKPVDWLKPGTLAGYEMLHEFITKRLRRYDDDRNLPNVDALSNLSAHFHFGQVSVQRAILLASDESVKSECRASVDQWVEQTVVRRELADNFCFMNRNYDNVKGAYDWAKKTFEIHRKDEREHIYSEKQLQFAKTHDPLWNACQIQMVRDGKMQGYLRQYWAKKFLEWTPSPEEALRICILMNDKYNLDGRDPNGYTGIMWAICGIHDTPKYPERPVVGIIRWMGYNGCARKFDIQSYMKKYKTLEQQTQA